MKLLVNNKTSIWNGKDHGNITLYGTTYQWDNRSGPVTATAKVSSFAQQRPTQASYTISANWPTSFEEVVSGGNVFIKIPTIYRKIITLSGTDIRSFEMATTKVDANYIPYSCFVDPNGNVMPYILIGKYMSTSDTTMNSVSGDPVRQTMDNARTHARALGTGYQLYDWQIHKLFQDLVVMSKKSINTNPGGSLIETMIGITNQDYQTFLDGMAKQGQTWMFAYNPANYISTPTTSSTGYVTANYIAPTGGNAVGIRNLGYDSSHPFFQHITGVDSGSNYTTYFCDAYQQLSSSNSRPIEICPGENGAEYGVYREMATNAWTDQRWVRLCYRPIVR